MPHRTSSGGPGRTRKARDAWSHLSRAAQWVVVTVLAAAIGAPVGTLATRALDGGSEKSDTGLTDEIELVLGPSAENEGDCSDGTGIEETEYGLALCHVDGTAASIDWIDVRLSIYAWAQRSDRNHEALLASWRSGALGPHP